MNGKNLLEEMGGIDMAFVEEAATPKKGKRAFRRPRIAAAAACLAVLCSIGTIACASGAVDAMKAYFLPQNETAGALLQEGTLTAVEGDLEMRVDHCIADRDEFIFTLSVIGAGRRLTVGDTLETAWITHSGERITQFNREFGAYTAGKGWGEEFAAHAVSMYDDADATFLVISEVPDGYRIEDLKAVAVSCRGLTMEVDVGDCIAETRTLSAADENGTITDLTASAIGFSFTCDSESASVSLIRADGTYALGDERDGEDGYYGYWKSTSSLDDSGRYAIRGRWGGKNAIATGILDLSRYIGIRVNDADYYFDP